MGCRDKFSHWGHLVGAAGLNRNKQADISDRLLFSELYYFTSSIANLFTSS